jgi:hypothetical protein
LTFSGNALSSESNRTVNNRLKLQPHNVSSFNPSSIQANTGNWSNQDQISMHSLATTPVTEVYHLHGLQLQRRTLDTFDHHHHHHHNLNANDRFEQSLPHPSQDEDIDPEPTPLFEK